MKQMTAITCLYDTNGKQIVNNTNYISFFTPNSPNVGEIHILSLSITQYRQRFCLQPPCCEEAGVSARPCVTRVSWWLGWVFLVLGAAAKEAAKAGPRNMAVSVVATVSSMEPPPPPASQTPLLQPYQVSQHLLPAASIRMILCFIFIPSLGIYKLLLSSVSFQILEKMLYVVLW